MNFELKLLAKSFDTDFSHNERSLPTFIFIIFGIIGIFLLPIFDSGIFQAIRIIIATAAIVFIVQKINFKKEDEILLPQIIGSLIFDGISMKFNTSGNTVIIDKNYQGMIQFKFGGYKGEIEGYGRNPNVYFGTNNLIELTGIDTSAKYYVFLNGTVDKRKFNTLIKWCYEQGISYKEFTHGEATYLGKKLSYKEIQEFKARKNPE